MRQELSEGDDFLHGRVEGDGVGVGVAEGGGVGASRLLEASGLLHGGAGRFHELLGDGRPVLRTAVAEVFGREARDLVAEGTEFFDERLCRFRMGRRGVVGFGQHGLSFL
jgi:hypothetical protein